MLFIRTGVVLCLVTVTAIVVGFLSLLGVKPRAKRITACHRPKSRVNYRDLGNGVIEIEVTRANGIRSVTTVKKNHHGGKTRYLYIKD
jgi:hypothetical protein